MKNILLVIAMLSLGAVAYARVDVDVGLGIGAPAPAPVYYPTPPAYYDPYVEAGWMSAPVQVAYFDGHPHRMHYWQGRWYDEAWRGHHHHDWQR